MTALRATPAALVPSPGPLALWRRSPTGSLPLGYSLIDARDHRGTLATIYADEGTGWDALHDGWDTKRVNHSVAFMDEGVCTNQAESYFSRLRRAEIGTHHHIAGPYLAAYANEMAWREDHRRVDNGSQAMLVAGAVMRNRQSRNWTGYWQRTA